MTVHHDAPSSYFGVAKQVFSPASFFSTGPVRLKIMFGLLAVLPLFGETFHYIANLRPLWMLSKAFPVLSLPLVLSLASYARFPMTRQIVLCFTWLVLSPSIAAIFYFNEGFFTGITAQVKLLPMLYFFSFLGLLVILRPSLKEIRRSFLFLGMLTVGVLILLWAIVPNRWYNTHYVFGAAPFFSADNRGHRIRMQMFFPIILLFYLYRRAFFEKKPDLSGWGGRHFRSDTADRESPLHDHRYYRHHHDQHYFLGAPAHAGGAAPKSPFGNSL
jgi:hypothetical protein